MVRDKPEKDGEQRDNRGANDRDALHVKVKLLHVHIIGLGPTLKFLIREFLESYGNAERLADDLGVSTRSETFANGLNVVAACDLLQQNGSP